jgi:hypothetical protein
MVYFRKEFKYTFYPLKESVSLGSVSLPVT